MRTTASARYGQALPARLLSRLTLPALRKKIRRSRRVECRWSACRNRETDHVLRAVREAGWFGRRMVHGVRGQDRRRGIRGSSRLASGGAGGVCAPSAPRRCTRRGRRSARPGCGTVLVLRCETRRRRPVLRRLRRRPAGVCRGAGTRRACGHAGFAANIPVAAFGTNPSRATGSAGAAAAQSAPGDSAGTGSHAGFRGGHADSCPPLREPQGPGTGLLHHCGPGPGGPGCLPDPSRSRAPAFKGSHG
jgi:hypothetical protein